MNVRGQAITIIQPELVNNNTRRTVLLSAGMCHTTAFNSVSIERAAFSGVSRGFKVGTKQLAAWSFERQKLQWCDCAALWPTHGKCFLWHVTKVVFQFMLRLLLYVYTRCRFPVIFNLLQDSSHWTAFFMLPSTFPGYVIRTAQWTTVFCVCVFTLPPLIQLDPSAAVVTMFALTVKLT